MRPRISIRGCVRISVRPYIRLSIRISVRMSIRLSVGHALFLVVKKNAFIHLVKVLRVCVHVCVCTRDEDASIVCLLNLFFLLGAKIQIHSTFVYRLVSVRSAHDSPCTFFFYSLASRRLPLALHSRRSPFIHSSFSFRSAVAWSIIKFFVRVPMVGRSPVRSLVVL